MPGIKVRLTPQGEQKIKEVVAAIKQDGARLIEEELNNNFRQAYVGLSPSPREEEVEISSPGIAGGRRFLKTSVGFLYFAEAVNRERASIIDTGSSTWITWGNIKRINTLAQFGWETELDKGGFPSGEYSELRVSSPNRWDMVNLWEYGSSFVVEPTHSTVLRPAPRFWTTFVYKTITARRMKLNAVQMTHIRERIPMMLKEMIRSRYGA